MPDSAVSHGGPLGGDLAFLHARANASLLAATNAALAALHLRVRSYAVLAVAGSKERMNQREIAAYLRLDPSQVVALIDGLQTRDLVQRTPDVRDRRTNVVATTADGDRLLADAREIVAAVERDAHRGLTENERVVLADLLRKTAFPTPV